jgi:hypothetical protein
MKKTLLLTSALAAGLLSTAQTSKINRFLKHSDNNHLNFVNSLLHTQQPATAQKPTGTAQRVIAQVYSEDGTIDSTHYKYTGTKGSRYNHNILSFGYNTDFGSNYAPMITLMYQADPLDLLADSITALENDELYYSAKGFYRTDNKLDSFYSKNYNSSNPADQGKTLHTFYPNGKIKEIISLGTSGSPTFDTLQVRRLTYNGTADKILTDTLLMNFGSGIEPVIIMSYHYNTQGKADTVTTLASMIGNFEPIEKAILSYTTSGKIEKISAFDVDGTTGDLNLYQKDSFAYAGGAGYFTFWESRSNFDESGVSQDGERIIKYPGTNGLPDSVIISSLNNNTWEEEVKLVYTYNTFDNPEFLTATSNGTPAGSIKFYYETYEDGISGINPIANNKDFSVYPNPFSNNINIDWKGKQQSNVTIRLTNIVGQEVYKTSMKLTAGKNAISIPSLNSGNYILLIQDADGKSWSSKMVKK